ncbi:MAG: hypothetical protein AAGE84_08355, partial [Cyanobacteria bacterium P01_G01_bin.39]
IDWCRQKTLFAIALCSCWSVNSDVLAMTALTRLESKASLIIAQKLTQNECQQANSTYREVYSFETEYYLINICQLNNNFYYYRQSKYDESDQVLISAQPVDRGNVFQASDDQATYFVGKNGDRYYSSVMQNDDEIVFEPELQSSNSDLSGDLTEVNSSLPAKTRLTPTENASLELDNRGATSEQSVVCTREKSTFDPRLDGWYKLLGKSTTTASKYAANNGYDFIYSEQKPEIASIIVEDEAVVNLSITTPSATIEQVCIQSESDD